MTAALDKLQSGHTFAFEGNFSQAEAAYREACRLYRDRGSAGGEGMTLSSLAQLRWRQALTLSDAEEYCRLLQRSIDTYGEAIQLLQTRSVNETVKALIGLMQAYRLNGNTRAALATARRAREISQSISHPRFLYALSRLEEHLNNMNRDTELPNRYPFALRHDHWQTALRSRGNLYASRRMRHA
jgi:tetratricopeptide (TPR) repeat protein